MVWGIKYKGFPDAKYSGPMCYLSHQTNITHGCWTWFYLAAKYETHEQALEAFGQTVAALKSRAKSCTLAWRGVSGV